MQAVLVMFRNDGERRSFSLSREMTVIGRRQDCDLMIPLGEISRKHCRIIRDSDSLRLEDLGSSNGTFHNGRRVQEAVSLSLRDRVRRRAEHTRAGELHRTEADAVHGLVS